MKLTLTGHDDRYAVEQLQLALFPEDTQGEAVSALHRGKTWLTAGPLYYTKTYAEGTKLHLAGLDITVLQTPGHTPGSVCLLTENALFSGDTLFAGSCGRTDLPGGSWSAIQASLNRLAALEADLWVLPGHGETSTLDEEKRHNPYLR